MVAVEEVVGVEGDEAAVGVDDVDTGFLYAADVEGVGVDELHDDDAEDVFVRQGHGRKQQVPRLAVASLRTSLGMTIRCHISRSFVGDPDFGEAAEEFAEGAGATSWGMIRGEELEEVGADGGVLFVEDGVGGAVYQDFGRDHAGQRDDLAAEL